MRSRGAHSTDVDIPTLCWLDLQYLFMSKKRRKREVESIYFFFVIRRTVITT